MDQKSIPELLADEVNWLLHVRPLITEAELVARGGNPASHDLLRLETVDSVVFPAFQFIGDGGTIRPIVVEINRKLNAHGDPLGVADWWLGAFPYHDKGTVNADCIDRPDTLRRLAAMVGEDL